MYREVLANSNHLRDNSHFCDVQLQSRDGILFEAHSVILSSWSKVLHTMLLEFTDTTDKSKRITLKLANLKGDVLGVVIQFMYGNTPTSETALNDLAEGCNVLEISKKFLDLNKFIARKDTEQYCEDNTQGPLSETKSPGFEDPVQNLQRMNSNPESSILRMVTRAKVSTRSSSKENGSGMSEEGTILSNPSNTAQHNHDDKVTLKRSSNHKVDNMPKLGKDYYDRTEQDSLDSTVEVMSSKAVALRTDENQSERFQCDICRKGFKSSAHFEGHQNVHHGNTPYACRKCPKTFAYSMSLKRHGKKCKGVVNPRVWSCAKCNFSGNTNKEYLAHVKGHHSALLQCSKCPKQFRTEKRLEGHIRSVHGSGNICPLCGKHFQSQSGFEQHTQTHENRFPHTCAVCGKGFHNFQHYEGHVNKHTGEKPFMCTMCGTCFGYMQAMQAHEKRCKATSKTISNQPAEPTCNLCDLVFKNAHSLQSHMRGKHGNQSLKCETCDQTFIWRQSYNRHRSNCKGPPVPEEEEAKVHGCSHCAARFKLLRSLKEHIQAQHETPKFSCAKCSARFKWKSQYYRHRRSCNVAAPSQIDRENLGNGDSYDEQVIEGGKQLHEIYEQQQELLAADQNLGVTGSQLLECELQESSELSTQQQADVLNSLTLSTPIQTTSTLTQAQLNVELPEDVTNVQILDSVTQWQYAEPFPYQ